jgi:hypothetical protein
VIFSITVTALGLAVILVIKNWDAFVKLLVKVFA